MSLKISLFVLALLLTSATIHAATIAWPISALSGVVVDMIRTAADVAWIAWIAVACRDKIIERLNAIEQQRQEQVLKRAAERPRTDSSGNIRSIN